MSASGVNGGMGLLGYAVEGFQLIDEVRKFDDRYLDLQVGKENALKLYELSLEAKKLISRRYNPLSTFLSRSLTRQH